MIAFSAIWSALSTRAGQLVAAAVGILAAVFAIYRSGRRAGQDGARIDAATSEQEARREGDAAAADAARDGAAERLRQSRF